MRPKRVILLYANEETIPLYRMPLEGFRFRVVAEYSTAGALAAFAETTPDVVVFVINQTSDVRAAECMRAMNSKVPIVLIGYPSFAATLLLQKHPPMREVIEACKRFAKRKRGPEKGWKKRIAQVEAVRRAA